MERIEEDATPAEEWEQSLNATCNRLSTQYINLIRAAASLTALEPGRQHDPRSGGGHMLSLSDPPPPPLAADVALATVQCQTATENICVAASHLLSLIRTARLSLLLMDHDTVLAEEQRQVDETTQRTREAYEEMIRMEHEYLTLRQENLHRPSPS